MAGIVLDSVAKVYDGNVRAVDCVDLTVADGEFVVLVGPSGCGKSTLLRMIAGLEHITEGTVRIGEKDVTNAAPRDRDIAMVFQNYALYPQMKVRDNLAFGLKLRKTPKDEREQRVLEVATILGLEDLLDRTPRTRYGPGPDRARWWPRSQRALPCARRSCGRRLNRLDVCERTTRRVCRAWRERGHHRRSTRRDLGRPRVDYENSSRAIVSQASPTGSPAAAARISPERVTTRACTSALDSTPSAVRIAPTSL